MVLKNPVPFHAPILSALSEHAELSVAYLSSYRPNTDFTSDLPYPGARLGGPPLSLGKKNISLQVPHGLRAWVRRSRPEAALIHSIDPASIYAHSILRHARVPTAMWSESTDSSGTYRGSLSTRYRRWAVNSVAAHVTNGSAATEFLKTLDVPCERIFQGIYPVAPQAFQSCDGRPSSRPTIAYVGRLIDVKRPDLFIAAARMVKQHVNADFLCAGGGPMRKQLERLDAAHDVNFTGALEPSSARSLIESVDILVLPSQHEVWGLVVNEALLAGTFVIGSQHVGSMHDLVVNGETGCICSIDRAEDLARAIRQAIERVNLTPAGRRERRRLALEHEPRMRNPASFAATVCQALEYAVARTT
jgi:glycosyltransferase involved in cell wall biosynthesis